MLKKFHLSISDKIGLENVFYDFSRKIGIFPNGLVDHGFGQKLKLFHLYISSKIGLEKASCDILERKKPFLDYKNKKFKKSVKLEYF